MAVVSRQKTNARRANGGLALQEGSSDEASAWGPVEGSAATLEGWRAALREDMSRELADPRWPRALMGVGVVHLTAFVVCQVLAEPVSRRDLRYLAIWFVELVAVFVAMRLLAGRHWIRRNAAVNLVAKLWTTFLILSFNVVSLNSLVGIEHPWFKAVWCTLSTFFFASLAWLFSPLFFIPAVQMWGTGLLMATFDPYAYAIYGVSWCLALCGVAAHIRRTH
ncbi:hypothetical protein [Paludisphaera mucosa]|uniref:Uncharacterized protein n=1 Tax=Paludisphaera mucosa TaxID=3030827 RepID=A0ABT6FH48_9BACT|nr:hypothetical protein [Paludisphaera mucosa]MDG3006908.1 hypothetical protein [Paludisphaera mucosa]